MGNHWLAKAHIAKWNKLTEREITELTSSRVDETALAILKWQGSRGVTIVSSQRKISFHIHVHPYWQKWQTKHSNLAGKDFETSEFHQDTWNCYLMLRFVSAHDPWNAISDLELPWLYKMLHDDYVRASVTTLGIICRTESALTVHALKK